MAAMVVLYWRDIPCQIIVKSGRTAAKRELPERFIRAIDAAAMRSGASGTDEYLADWRRGDPIPCDEDLQAEASDAAARIEAEYSDERLAALVNQGGFEVRSLHQVERRH
jgi:Virulence factor